MARIPKTAILLGAVAVGLLAALRGRKPKEEEPELLLPDVEPPIPEDLPIPEETALGTPVELIKHGEYIGQRGAIVWQILRDPTGFYYEWKWAQNEGGGKEFATLEEAEAALLEDMQNEVGLEVDPADVIRPLISQSRQPQSGMFYQIRKNDRLLWIVSKVLGISESDKFAGAALRCVTSSDWNTSLYGTRWDKTYSEVGQDNAVMKDGVLTVISKAFLPRHQNAMSEMLSGRIPQRTIDNTPKGDPLGVPRATLYGLIWIPVMRIQDNTLFCPEGNWSDGRSQSEPPPEVMAVLR